nr:hypothetical protein [Tanacetum cinerariifolium]
MGDEMTIFRVSITSESIVGLTKKFELVASMDEAGSAKYKALLSPQPRGVEIVYNLYTLPLTDKGEPVWRCPQLLKEDMLGLNDSSGVTMVLGTDVTHFNDKSTPSIVAFVASMDAPVSVKYKALLPPQSPGVEIIPNLYTPSLTDKGEFGGLMSL